MISASAHGIIQHAIHVASNWSLVTTSGNRVQNVRCNDPLIVLPDLGVGGVLMNDNGYT
jgi:hypothetical protein